jgi:hypothetical protein
MAVTTKNFWDVALYGSVKTDVSEEHVASIFKVEEIMQVWKY